MQCIACVCNFKVRNLIVRCDLKQNDFTMGSCSIPGSTTWWSRQFYWDKIQSNPRSPWYIWWFFREHLTFWGIFKVQFVLPSSIFVSFTSHRSRRCALSFLFYLFLSMFRKLGPRSGFTRSCGFSFSSAPLFEFLTRTLCRKWVLEMRKITIRSGHVRKSPALFLGTTLKKLHRKVPSDCVFALQFSILLTSSVFSCSEVLWSVWSLFFWSLVTLSVARL